MSGDGFVDSEAPYPDGCGPDCKGCDPCVCGHPWSEHTDPRYEFGTGCLHVSGCPCTKFDSRFKAHVFFPAPTEQEQP